MTATVWDEPTMDPTGWWMAEKYDGMRLLWNGSEFYTRNGNIVKVPDSIKSGLPKVSLDGELW
jgi:DNA ligase-1